MGNVCHFYIDGLCSCLKQMLLVKVKYWTDYRHCEFDCGGRERCCEYYNWDKIELLKYLIFEYGRNYEEMFKEIYEVLYDNTLGEYEALEIKYSIMNKHRVTIELFTQADADAIVV